MTTITFDTLELTEKLKNAGIEQQQAEGIVRAIAEAQDSLATKDDLKKDLDALESRLEAKMQAILNRHMQWQSALMIALTGIFAAIVKLT